MRHKYSPVILQALGGPNQKDYEYEKKLFEFKEAKNRMSTMKKVIDNFPKKLEGHKQLLDTIVGTCENIFDKNQKNYFQFMHNITSAHKALADKLGILFNQFGQLTNMTNIWVKEMNEVIAKCRQREECRKNYEHYEQKLYELNTDRMKDIKKENKISESDHERFVRNVGKFQKAGKEYIFSSNSAYKCMENFLNIRYDRIVSAMINLIEAERAFYNEANHIMNFFTNIRNNSMGLKQTLIVTNSKYDAGYFIKGTPLFNMSVEDLFNSNYRPPPQPGFNPGGSTQVQYGVGQSFSNNNNNTQNNKTIVNPFSADNSNFENNNNNNDNNYNYSTFRKINTFSGGKTFNNKSTRETFASSNPYNTQANPYSANNNNMNNNNNFGGNNNYNNPYNGQQNNINPYGGKNDEDPFNDNNVNPYDGNNKNQNPYDNGPKDNNQGGGGDEDPFDF